MNVFCGEAGILQDLFCNGYAGIVARVWQEASYGRHVLLGGVVIARVRSPAVVCHQNGDLAFYTGSLLVLGVILLRSLMVGNRIPLDD